jgi:ATP-binding cassette subfamily B protein
VGKGKTVFIIAHRLSTVRNADQILFIEQGQIAEQGTFSELLKLNGRFAHFWNLQHAISQWKLRRSNDCEASAA